MSSVEQGFLVLADLTGYTAYLARGELAHAPVIAGDLLETVVGRLEPPFRLAKFEGDAAFLFAEDDRAEPSLLLDSIEASYLAFRRRLRSIESATSCDCQACSLAPRLDLKYFVHHGPYLRSSIAGRDELAGPEVIVAHRLLKGTAAADARGHGFAVFTSAATTALGMDPEALALTAGHEQIEHIGEVATYTLDLERSWTEETARRRLDAGGGLPLFDIEAVLAAEPAVVWAHLTSPTLRPRWEGPIDITETPLDGRRGLGTMTRCVTGRLATIEEIVDWQPYDHVGRRIAVPGLGPIDASTDLEADGARTRVRVSWVSHASDPIDAATVEVHRRETQAALDRLHGLLGREVAVLEERRVTG